MTELDAVDATATRGFFVDMIVRDIDVNGAILDLIDNAVDAALSQASGESLAGYVVEVTIDASQFSIQDNCGGIDIDVARKYAFRFGRAPEFQPESRIGQFGIGMKRAVFRLGNRFLVESVTESERFTIDVDVSEWRQEEGEWEFPMRIDTDHEAPYGTFVKVTELRSNVSEQFQRTRFVDDLRTEIKDRYTQAIVRGLEIIVNQQPVEFRIHRLLSGFGIIPEHVTETLYSNGDAVTMTALVGIAPPRRPASESGWYIYCNGRLVVKADRTSATGWGTAPPGDRELPAWHNQYLRFRGYVFLESNNPAALPWSTTKTEIDKSSPVYLKALGYMQSMIRRYATFTNELSLERTHAEEADDSDEIAPTNIQDAINKASAVTLAQIPEGKFKVPERATQSIPKRPPGPRTSSIQFNVLTSEIDELKRALRLRSNKQVGETAFVRLYEEEIG